ncbi:glycosyltransferase [Alcanivorax marinus]|uniref:Glycosyltransferase n=1 Tax=Alloalcanivorax marinus TaxID=1177169 RepID=A0A9Q3YSD9_9GAMM|nr:glycosyltransferase [Alloalcanivorax marinus]MCC4309528.1 glycosyltransferase [Alloalcanivorax marinus]
MRILLSITSLGVGGAERLVTGLADYFAAAGHQVVVVAFHGEIELRPVHPAILVVGLGMRRSPWGVITALWKLRRMIRSFRPDVINSHLVHANILTRLLRLVTIMPRLVSSAHNTNEEGCGRMLAYRLTDYLADISSNVSEEAVAAFEEQRAIRPGRMVAIHNGIDTRVFVFDKIERFRVRAELGLNDDTPLLLAVGRLWEAKDYPNLLNAFARMSDQVAGPHLAIVGDGPLCKELGALAGALGVAHRVHFLGIRHDIPAVMAASDVFVLSSAWEGFGLVVAEAMACERPVVATDSGGVREVVGDAGFLVPSSDSEALAQSIEAALALSPEARVELGRAARQRVVTNFSLATTAERYLALYQAAGKGAA